MDALLSEPTGKAPEPRQCPGSTAGAQLWKRSGTDEARIASTSAFTALGSPVPSQAFSPGVTYTAVLTIKRTSSGTDLALARAGGKFVKDVRMSPIALEPEPQR